MAVSKYKYNGGYSAMAVPPQPACHSCREPVSLQDDNLLIEVVQNPLSENNQVIVWHQDCYDQFLEDGEE